MAAPALPAQFPCWCRAVYSWGGEGPKDLGFIEGDLIECLNAGDGSWWVGRLRRDPRMIGSFPSNFVKVLDSSFTPVNRAVSPLPDLARSGSDSLRNTQAEREAKKARAKSRKPFQGYKSALPPKGALSSATATATATTTTTTTTTRSAPPSPQKPSMVTMQHHDYFDLSPSPSHAPLWQSSIPSRSPSPLPDDIGSPPPPPPPPHRILRGVDPVPSREMPPSQPPVHGNGHGQYRDANTPSPGVASMNGHTPPMIRSAMDDVLSSLDDMTVAGTNSEPVEQPEEEDAPLNPWSPEAFNLLHSPSRSQARPLTSLGLGAGGSNYSEPRVNYSSRHNSPDRFHDGGSHQLETYVQRMESRLRQMQEARDGGGDGFSSPPPQVPPKNSPWAPRPQSALNLEAPSKRAGQHGSRLNRTFTTKTNSTNTTNSSSFVQSEGTAGSNVTSATSQSLFSGYSAGGFSATSAGSLARKRMGSIRERLSRPMTSSSMRGDLSGDASSTRSRPKSAMGWEDKHRRPSSVADTSSSLGGLGGFGSPVPKKQGFFKKLIDTARTGAASARSTISVGEQRAPSPTKMVGIAGGSALSLSPRKRKSLSNLNYGLDAAKEMGLLSTAEHGDIVVRRDVYRSNTPGPSERQDRADRCAMLDHPVICPVEELYAEFEGDEDGQGQPVYSPFQLNNPGFSQIDKAARSIASLPTSINAAALATGYVCRPYRTMAQRLRALFIWCAERITWEDDGYEASGRADSIRVIQTKRGSSREVATLVVEMCRAIHIHAELVHGYLKTPGDELDLDAVQRPNHFWNMVLVDNEWRLLDASLASPTNPMRAKLSSVSSAIADPWYFLARPCEACWTHVPCEQRHQHMVPPVSPDSLLALPQTCPQFFYAGVSMHAYDTSIIRMEGLEVCTLAVNVPGDIEIVAEVEARAILVDKDGDRYEDADRVVRKRALVQPAWYRTVPSTDISQKRYVIKAILPGDEGRGVLKVYAGKKGLMISARDIVHPLAFALPLYHFGQNPTYEFVKRHPTPHATRHDLYIVQPQTGRLRVGETYVFCVRQHQAAAGAAAAAAAVANDDQLNPLIRPTSAMSMTSSSAAGSNPSQTATIDSSIAGGAGGAGAGIRIKDKPAKLAVQSPGGKITRLPRRSDLPQNQSLRDIDGDVLGSVWENTLKLQERGTWRGLVLADRQARWCVWAEWECV